MQIESNTKRITFFFIAECSLPYQKIMQIEGNTKRITFFFIAECSLSYCKSRKIFIFYRRQKQNCPTFYLL